ncbi:RelA/SpoT domain-containing protein [Shewanella sp. Isolate8]|uniref:RelA/SpoT domain-containing protein n=1 Tax=Shewanella sp. Isolate8 TaxID=2908529 RepID=UPI001EFE4872|nr:RelA/SpoT domain-containing protein [Shewanella sp. Isolate8]MCG9747907.1 RelA/SpoT domain-containing protein [Shewanella sp. Isolate8]
MIDSRVRSVEEIKKPSGKQVLRAGECLINSDTYLPQNEDKLNEAFSVLSYWRFSYEKPLENALDKLQPAVKEIDEKAIFAKRLKRFPSIVLKLRRFPKMNLKNMQDIGGCRIVLGNSKKVAQVSRVLRKMPEFRWDDGFRIKDYIKEPKDDGYRSLHIVGRFPDLSGRDKKIEVQLRTRIQHYWATALEIIDLFTKQSLKTNQGQKMWSDFFINVSKQFAIMDNIHLFESLSDKDKKIQYISRLINDKESSESVLSICENTRNLKVADKLKAFANSLKIIGEELDTIGKEGYVLLEVNILNKSLTYTHFSEDESKEAQDIYTETEKITADKDSNVVVALVYANAVGGIREAYPNFFADSSKFSEHLEYIMSAENIFRQNFFAKLLKKANLADSWGDVSR